MRSRTSRYRLYFIAVGFALFLAVSLIAGLKLGYLEISWQQLLACLADFPTSWQSNEPLDDTILNLRMPRVVLAAAVGMGLAVCGVVMQAILANPLADPYILGVSSGASLGAAVAIFFGAGALFGAQSIGIFAAAGAFFISLLVLLLVSAGKGNMSTRLLLAGMAFHAVCSSITSFIVFVGGNREGMQSFSFWLLGNVANTKWENVSVLLVIVVLLSIFFLTQSRRLNLLLLGEEDAVVLGLDAKHWRLVLLAVEALLIGFIVYNAGIVGFVGLIVPHISRAFFGADHWVMLPMSVLLGGIVGVWADILGRTLFTGVEVPFGVMLALLGGPFFLYLVVRRSYGFGKG